MGHHNFTYEGLKGASLLKVQSQTPPLLTPTTHLHHPMNSQDSSFTTSQSQHFRWHYAELDDSNFKMHGHTLLLLVLVLLSIILLLFLFFLYTRWVCRYRHHHSHTSPDLPTEPPTRPLGLDRVIIDNLPILLHRSPVEEEVQCCICLSNFQDQEKVKILPGCTHTYHPDCVDKWLVTHSNCPLCRASLQVDSAV